MENSVEVPFLEMKGVQKSFSGVHALKGVDLRLGRGEVLALLGENGAGKSTLMKILGGAHHPDKGTILIDGQEVKISSPHDSQKYGISIIYQEFNLIPGLTVRENIFLGREETKLGFFNKKQEQSHSQNVLKRIGIELDLDAPCKELTVAQQQITEIAKALSIDAKIIVMDEPSAALTEKEVEKLFKIIKDLKSQGIGVIYISHRLDEIFQIADRIMVLRDGKYVGERGIKEVTRKELIELMVGRKIEDEFPKVKHARGAERLRVQNLTRKGAVNDVSFFVHAGEIVGFSGLVGAGRTETARLIFGADQPDSGKIFIDRKEKKIKSPRDAINNRIAFLTEDRKAQGLVLIHSVRDNFALPNLKDASSATFINDRKITLDFDEYIDKLAIKVPNQEALAKNLSGGNQQKVVLAKWLEKNCDIIIFDEPTRGIDVGAKYEIYLLMNDLAKQGKAVMMISSELPEVLGMSDRIIVMHEGKIKGEITDPGKATQESIMHMAIN
ncbi:MAG: sugar ABC transporter ATP-binding protein [Lentisphaerota bacterium]